MRTGALRPNDACDERDPSSHDAALLNIPPSQLERRNIEESERPLKISDERPKLCVRPQRRNSVLIFLRRAGGSGNARTPSRS